MLALLRHVGERVWLRCFGSDWLGMTNRTLFVPASLLVFAVAFGAAYGQTEPSRKLPFDSPLLPSDVAEDQVLEALEWAGPSITASPCGYCAVPEIERYTQCSFNRFIWEFLRPVSDTSHTVGITFGPRVAILLPKRFCQDQTCASLLRRKEMLNSPSRGQWESSSQTTTGSYGAALSQGDSPVGVAVGVAR